MCNASLNGFKTFARFVAQTNAIMLLLYYIMVMHFIK